MRLLAVLMLATASTAFSTLSLPTASACHPDPAVDGDWAAAPGYYVVRDVGYGGCPHELTFCLQVWRESNGRPGLQTSGTDPDTLIVLVCPLP